MFTQSAVGWGVEELYKLELREGVTWSHVFAGDEDEYGHFVFGSGRLLILVFSGRQDSLSLIFVMEMFVVQTTVQLMMAWYVSNVCPGIFSNSVPVKNTSLA